MDVNSFIIITSIYEPTEAVKKFANLPGYTLIVVGDKKTPPDWSYPGVKFLSVADQHQIGSLLNKDLPYNHYCRKMMGYLYAIKQGSKIIYDSDDDNIPKEHFDFPPFEGNFLQFRGNKRFINIYQYFTNQKIWPRGLPPRYINDSCNFSENLQKTQTKVGIWQGLADDDPDVDAIYRLTYNNRCFFSDKEPVVLREGAISPFNTQNTLIRKELFPLLYLPAFVTFRFTDIMRGLVAQPIMWKAGYLMGFTKANVVQERNVHDLMKDFESEIPVYQYSEKVVELTDKATSANNSIMDNLFNAYHVLQTKGIVKKHELTMLENWLSDLREILKENNEEAKF